MRLCAFRSTARLVRNRPSESKAGATRPDLSLEVGKASARLHHHREPRRGMGPSCGSLLSSLRAAVPKRSKALSSVGTVNQLERARGVTSTMMSATCDVLQWHQVASLEA